MSPGSMAQWKTEARTLGMAGISNAGTPTLPRLPKPAAEPQSAGSIKPLSPSGTSLKLDELGEEKRAANEFMAGRAYADGRFSQAPHALVPKKLMHIPASLLVPCICALLVLSTYAGASRPKRDLARLTYKELRLLTTSPEPSRNVNVKSADSHLSKILIPRPRMCQP
jgi:hypothetical protein